jgi:hypothetical protein
MSTTNEIINKTIIIKHRDQISNALIWAYLIAMCICFALIFAGATALKLGYEYIEIGYGLHPFIACTIGLGFLAFALLSFNTFVDLFAGFGDDDEKEGD